jgi:Xaa-Pro aminopeptidase
MNKEFFVGNRKRIADKLKPDSLMVLFAGKAPHLSSDMFYPFEVNRNFYYLTGIDQEESVLLVEKNGSDVTETLFIQKSNFEVEKWTGTVLSEEEAEEISGIKTISFIDDFDDYFSGRIFRCPFENLYFDFEKYGHGDERKSTHIFAEEIKKKYPYLQTKNIFPEIRNMRMIKQPVEIEEMKKAIKVTRLGIENIFANASPGMKEYQLEAYFHFIRKFHGLKRHIPDIFVSGKNAWILHYIKNDCVAKNGKLVLVDVGADSSYYGSDISRAFPINGKFTKRQRQIYNIVLKTQRAVINMIGPGVLISELNAMADKMLTEECKKIGLIKEDKDISKYYYHGIGHTLGLDVHDPRDMDPKFRLKEGMIITVEPGLYIKEEGIGVRIEDDILVTKYWYENLSRSIIKEPDEIEAFMAKAKNF